MLDELRKGVVLIVLCAFAIRVAYELVAPALHVLLVLVCLLLILGRLFPGHR